LLRCFGSVERIQKATPEEIAETESISKKLDEQISNFPSQRGG